uniref:BTB domain-containing protein n=1 Tax=Panagrolaimus davidi TaxID=227884 RepID=A0A914QZ19_9BILA
MISKEEIRLKLQREEKLYKMVPLFPVETYERVFENFRGWGDIICTIEEFFDDGNNYFIDNFIYITLEGIVSGIKNMQKNCVRSYNLGELLYNQNDKDFEIYSTNGKCVKVHKLVISAKSSVFDRMIHSSGFKESKENKVLIKDFDYEIIEIAIKYCYRISIFESLNISNGIKLLQFSDKYDISDLKVRFNGNVFIQS